MALQLHAARRIFAVLAAGLLLAPAAFAQEEILFVFGSDTSTPGIQVDRYSTVYPEIGFDMFAAPTRQGYRIMDEELRERHRDSYGTPLKLTWWMQGGSLYRQAANTNVPLGSTMSAHLMYRHHREAIEQLGDEMSFHFHSWVWTDYDGDRRFYWNQAKSFAESREDFDRALAEHLIEEDLFPISFRSGWHYMDNLWQARLDSLLPFSLHNAWPSVRTETSEPIDNVFDWSRSPRDFVPFRPSAADYQLPGGTRGWNTGSLYMKAATDQAVRKMFAAARAGERQVVCLWSHLAEADFVEQVEAAASTIARVAADYPDVPFRYETGVAAMQRWLGTDDLTPPAISIEETEADGGVVLRISSDEPLFQPLPFVALLDRYDRYHTLDVVPTGTRTWETEPFDHEGAAHVAVAATDTSGNLSTRHVRYLPDDIYVDNSDALYLEDAGNWESAPANGYAQVWGRDYRLAVLERDAHVRWMPEIEQEAVYNVFVRIPDDGLEIGAFDVLIRTDGTLVDSTHFAEAPTPAGWTFAGAAHLRPGAQNAIKMSARASDGRVLAADAVKLTARIHERRLAVSTPFLDFGDIIAGDSTEVFVSVANTGTSSLTISEVSSLEEIVSPDMRLPVVLGPLEKIRLPLVLYRDRQGALQDTLLIESDDPAEPMMYVPFQVRVMDHYQTVDDADASGYEEKGAWSTSVTQAYGPRSRYSTFGTGNSAIFSGTAVRKGVYAWTYLVPKTENAAIRARYVVSSGGGVLDTLIIDQNRRSGTWRTLGLYRLEAGEPYEIELAWGDGDQPGRVLRTDAVRLFHVGEEIEDFVIDNDGSGYREEGSWAYSVSTASYGAGSRYAFNDAQAAFRAEILRDGMHGVYQIVPTTVNAARNAVYVVSRNGTLVDSVFIDQNKGSGEWQLLGAYWFARGDEVEVEVALSGPAEPGRVLRADAVRFVYGGEMATAVHDAPPPTGFRLGPNHPNPAHGATTFDYVVAEPSKVRIRLFDVLGREVARLAEAHQAAGTYTKRIDVSRLPSGLYFCRMEAGEFTTSRTWVIVR